VAIPDKNIYLFDYSFINYDNYDNRITAKLTGNQSVEFDRYVDVIACKYID
jgi:hypothetical protein